LVEINAVDLALSSKAGRVDILHDIHLQIGSGETVGILGPSGSGKTSLLMVMAGLERVSGGQVLFEGREITHLGEDDRLPDVEQPVSHALEVVEDKQRGD
jgi:putative ABC transport system ATP-binding protein